MRASGVFFEENPQFNPLMEIAADTGIVSGVSIMDEVMDKD